MVSGKKWKTPFSTKEEKIGKNQSKSFDRKQHFDVDDVVKKTAFYPYWTNDNWTNDNWTNDIWTHANQRHDIWTNDN